MVNNYRSEEINEIVTALSKFQGSVPTIEKNKSVNFKSRTGQMTSYSYADIADVMKIIRKPLSENGLFVSHSIQITREGRDIITTVFHSSGQWLKSSMLLELTSDEKTLGAKITYYRRYSLGSLLGLVTDDDVDCDLQGCEPVPEPAKPAPAPVKPAPVKTQKKHEMTSQMNDFYKLHMNKAYFKEFISFISKKTKNTEFEIISQGMEYQERFFEALMKFRIAEENKKAPSVETKKKPEETTKNGEQ
jgi:hypothetical protein